MIYRKIVPEIMVDLGEHTIFENPAYPYYVEKLHINLESWEGDDLLENAPCHIVTEGLKNDLANSKYTGFHFEEMELTKDFYFDDNYQLDKEVPVFYRLHVTGIENKDDVHISDDYLYISERLLSYIQHNFSIKNARIAPVRNEFDNLLDSMFEKRAAAKKNENKEADD